MTINQEETVAAFAKRIGLTKTTVSRKLHEPECPIRSFTAFTGDGGRIMSLCASPELEAFMLNGKRNHTKEEK